MEIKVTKIVSMTSNVEATVNELSINANVRVRNNDTIEGVDSGNVNDSTGNQLASFSYYGSNNLNINYQTNDSTAIQEISKQVSEFLEQCKSNINSLTTVSVN